MTHPYRSFPRRAFWRGGTDADADGVIPDLYQPKFDIDPETAVATAGSCFAQHIGRALRHSDSNLLDVEPPIRRMPAGVASQFSYGAYSARYGNIYTPLQLLELLKEVQTGTPDPDLVWERDDRFFDALRPGVEPEGLASAEDVLTHRKFHLTRVAQMLEQADVMVFTLGLTEAWVDEQKQRVLPVCPGVIAGIFDPARHRLHNFRHADIVRDLTEIRQILRQFQPDMKMILTVSPVPLTATARTEHVVSATISSKATLRAAAGEFVQDNPDADYFPAYEIVTTAIGGGPWFAPNGRNIMPEGIDRVMRHFFAAHGLARTGQPADDDASADSNCEDILLQAFAP